MDQPPRTRLRKADFWTSLFLIAIAGYMIGEALGYPLEGSYAGVRNVWYVSPALFPLIVGFMLLGLSGYLLANSIREGGARLALAEMRDGSWGRAARGAADLWIVALILAGYIAVLVPRIDFPVATLGALFTLLAVYHAGPRAARPALAAFCLIALGVAASALAGFRPAPRSAAFYWRDAAVLAALILQFALVARAVRADAAARRRLRISLATAVLTPLILSAVFKYGLIVPLPAEGLVVEAMERIRYGRL